MAQVSKEEVGFFRTGLGQDRDLEVAHPPGFPQSMFSHHLSGRLALNYELVREPWWCVHRLSPWQPAEPPLRHACHPAV